MRTTPAASAKQPTRFPTSVSEHGQDRQRRSYSTKKARRKVQTRRYDIPASRNMTPFCPKLHHQRQQKSSATNEPLQVLASALLQRYAKEKKETNVITIHRSSAAVVAPIILPPSPQTSQIIYLTTRPLNLLGVYDTRYSGVSILS